MKMNTRYAAVVGTAIGTALLVSYAVADPGHGHAYGHSQAGTSSGAISGVPTSGAQLAPGDGLAAATFKNGSDFFTTATAEKSRGHDSDFIGVPANSQTGAQKNDPASQFLTPTSAGSNTSAVASSATTATSKPISAADATAQKPDWIANASSDRGPKAKPSPIPSATPTGAKPSSSATPGAVPALTPSQPSINPPPDI